LDKLSSDGIVPVNWLYARALKKKKNKKKLKEDKEEKRYSKSM